MAFPDLNPPPLRWADLPAGPLWLIAPTASAIQLTTLARIRAAVPLEPDTVWVLSSGTESVDRVKCLGISRAAMLTSAAAVNAHLRATAGDRWLVAIPRHHVGGFSIAARAHLTGAGLDELPAWDPRAFVDACAAFGTTLTSLVPTQVYDLVAAQLHAPPKLRAIVVGGAALDPKLYAEARARGWPVLPSYGLTETASQIATSDLDSPGDRYPDLTILSHARVAVRDGRLWIDAQSSAHWRAVADSDGAVTLTDPRADGWIVTEDLGEVTANGRLRVFGRGDDVVKILGVLVSVPRAERSLHARGADPKRVIVRAVPDSRAGHRLVAFTDQTTSLADLGRLIDTHNADAPGPERIDRACWVECIPRTDLGKIRAAALFDDLGLST